jgi:hypothetical protein
MEIAIAAVSMKSALKYRRNWDKKSPTVKLLQKLMPRGNNRGYRLYFPIGGTLGTHSVKIPAAVRHALTKAGYVATDYLAKKCVKVGDKEQKNVFNIGKVIGKDHIAKAAFDNDPQLQNSKSAKFEMVVSCHPYDIIGMSTGRDWDAQSCMRLRDGRGGMDDGINADKLNNDVAEGTLVAYAVKSGDSNITTPLGRCLLKPFISEKGDVMYRRELKIYGNPVPGFTDSLNKFLRKLNKNVPDGMYEMSSGLYDDGVGRTALKESGNSSGTNWSRLVKIHEYLATSPEEFPDYVSYVIKDLSKDLNRASEQMMLLRNNAKNVDSRNIKIGARLIADNPEAVAAFADGIKHGNANGVGRFLASKRLARAVHKAMPDYNVHNSRAMSHVDPKGASKLLEGVDDDNADWSSTALDYVRGRISLNTKDIVARPNLHKMIWEVLNIYREAAMFGVNDFQDSVHAALGKLPAPEKPGISEDDFRPLMILMQNTVNDPEIFCTWMLQLLRDNRVSQAETVAEDLIQQSSFNKLLEFRKWRRKLVGQGFPERIQQYVTGAVMNILAFNKGDNSTQRDLMAAVQSSGIMVDDFYELPSLLINKPELFPMIEAHTPEVDGYMLSILLPQGDEIAPALAKLTGSHVARNPDQQILWNMLGTVAMVQKNAPEHFTFEFDSFDTLRALEKANLQSSNIDLIKYPMLLTMRNAQSLSPDEFLGNDRGFRYIQVMEKKSPTPKEFCQLLGSILYNSGTYQAFASAAGAPSKFTAADSAGRVFFADPESRLEYKPEAILRDCENYLARLQEFVETFPEDETGGEHYWKPYVEWLEAYTDEQVKKDAFSVSGVFYQIKKAAEKAVETLDSIKRIVKTADQINAEDDSLLDDLLS